MVNSHTTECSGDLSIDEDPRADLRWGTVPNLISEVAGRLKESEALVDRGERISFAELHLRCELFARALIASGLKRSERVAIWAPNCLEWVVCALGVVSAGGILVPLNTRFKGGEAAFILRASGAKLLVCVESFLGLDYPKMLATQELGEVEEIVLIDGPSPPRLRASGAKVGRTSVVRSGEFYKRASSVSSKEARKRAEAVSAEDISDIIFTSGTTGHPKGAMATHAQTLRAFGTWASIVGLAGDDRYLVVNPFFHTFGYKAGVLACLMTGATLVAVAEFDAGLALELIEKERVSVLPGPPTLYQTLLDHPMRDSKDLSSLRLGVTGASIVPAELVDAAEKTLGFKVFLTAYGLTESCGVVTMCRRADPPGIVSSTSGRAIPGLEVSVWDAAGDEVDPGSPGEVVVRGYTVMSGYFDDVEETKKAIDDQGWLHTGDIGVLDEAGNLTITDRLKDMFVVGGFNAYPAEIEAILREHPVVSEVSVVGVPDERLGEVGCAFVLSRDLSIDQEVAELTTWARSKMANYKVPRHVIFVDSFPRNASGKVLKRVLREEFERSRQERNKP